MTERIDYAVLRALALDASEPIYDDQKSLAENILSLFSESIILPNQNIQLPVLVAYFLIPSAMADIVPIAFLQGDKGSGKSTATILASAIHESSIQSAATTFAALRNHFNKLRWADPEYFAGERNTILCWDNINKQTLDNEQIYTLLLCGYNRKTDSISISAGAGENQEFKVFGTKVLSSIHPIFTSSKYDELVRRLLVFKFKQWEKFSDQDRLGIPDDFDFDNRLDLDSYDLTVLHERFTAFWGESIHLEHYTGLKRQLRSRKNRAKLPKSFTSLRWTVSLDLLVSGVVTGIWPDVSTAISHLGRYWEWTEVNVIAQWGAAHKFLQAAIDELPETARSVNKSAGREIVTLEIAPKEIKRRLNAAYGDGEIEVIPNPTIVSQLMQDLGYRLDTSVTGKGMAWVRIS